MERMIIFILFVIFVMNVRAALIGSECYDERTKTVHINCEEKSFDIAKCDFSVKDLKPNVKVVRIEKCKVEDLIQFINSFENLSELNISSSDVDDSVFQQLKPLTQLKTLSLTNNGLEKIPSDFYHNMPKLIEIDLSNNKIKHFNSTVFKGAKALRAINLMRNNIFDVEIETNSLPNLRHLFLNENNELNTIFYPASPNDKYLELKFNEVSYYCNYKGRPLNSQSISVHLSVDKILYGPSKSILCASPVSWFLIRHLYDFDEKLKSFEQNPFRIQFEHQDESIKTTKPNVDISRDTKVKPPSDRPPMNPPQTTTATATKSSKSEQRVLGMRVKDFEMMCQIIIIIMTLILLVFIALIIRDYRIEKNKLRNRSQNRRRQASCQPNNIVRLKATPNHYVLK